MPQERFILVICINYFFCDTDFSVIYLICDWLLLKCGYGHKRAILTCIYWVRLARVKHICRAKFISFSLPTVSTLLSLETSQNLAQRTIQKIKFSIKGFLIKCDQICRKLRIWSHLTEEILKVALLANIKLGFKDWLFL